MATSILKSVGIFGTKNAKRLPAKVLLVTRDLASSICWRPSRVEFLTPGVHRTALVVPKLEEWSGFRKWELWLLSVLSSHQE